jgi:hypothetical protein
LVKNAAAPFCPCSENFAKDIERIMEITRSAIHTSSSPKRRVPVAVIGRSLILVDQDLVCLTEFLELVFRSGVSRIFVWMKFNGELAIGFLDIFDGGVPVHS